MATETTRIQRASTTRSILRSALGVYRRFPWTVKASFWILMGIIGAAAFAFVLSPYNPSQMGTQMHAAPSLEHPLGTDKFGRDVLARLLHGGGISLFVGFASVALGLSIGLPFGAVAGYFGGRIDDVIMRLVDTIFAFPSLVLAIGIIAVFGSGIVNVIFIIGFLTSAKYARVIRSEVLSIKQESYIEAARALGYSRSRILAIEIFPNSLAPIMVQAAFNVAVAILIEAGLSYLGLGVNPPTPTWGNMIQQGEPFLPEVWWVAIPPGLMIMLTVIVTNVIGDQLQDELNPQEVSE